MAASRHIPNMIFTFRILWGSIGYFIIPVANLSIPV
jgi:hypothetical protein